MPTTEIHIRDLRLRTIIGITDLERRERQDVVINVRIRYDAGAAMAGDDFSRAVDYKRITKRIIAEVEDSRFRLLEALAGRIYEVVREAAEVEAVEVVVDKPHALRFADSVAIRVADDA